jgi:hypothetical protein
MAWDVEDILACMDKPKKIKSGQKGKRTERELVHILNERFKDILSKNPTWGGFSRSIGSGNRWGQQVNLPKHAEDTFSGDLTCPEHFLFIFESKGGYNDVDLNAAFDGGHKQIDDFLKQVSDDANRTGRKPLLVWKKDRKPRLCFIRLTDVVDEKVFTYRMHYREWLAVNFDEVLKFPDDYFFQ